MKQHIPFLALAASAALSPVSAEWQLVTDFQNLDANTIPRYLQIQDASANLYIDFFDPFDETNKALYIDAGLRGTRCNAIFVAIPLPQEVPLGTTATFKFDFFQAGASYDLNAGLSPTVFTVDENALIVDPAAPAFNEFEAQVRMGSPLTVRDGSNFRQTLTTTPIGEWMTLYIIADGSSKTVEGYLRTGEGLEKIEVPVDSLVNDFWLWRIGRDETLKSFYIGSSNACERGYDSADIYLIDNVYIDYTGINLDGDEPIVTESWAGYPVTDGYADTGDFLGWINPVGDYAYSESMDAWLYVKETTVGPDGGWIYLYY